MILVNRDCDIGVVGQAGVGLDAHGQQLGHASAFVKGRALKVLLCFPGQGLVVRVEDLVVV